VRLSQVFSDKQRVQGMMLSSQRTVAVAPGQPGQDALPAPKRPAPDARAEMNFRFQISPALAVPGRRDKLWLLPAHAVQKSIALRAAPGERMRHVAPRQDGTLSPCRRTRRWTIDGQRDAAEEQGMLTAGDSKDESFPLGALLYARRVFAGIDCHDMGR